MMQEHKKLTDNDAEVQENDARAQENKKSISKITIYSILKSLKDSNGRTKKRTTFTIKNIVAFIVRGSFLKLGSIWKTCMEMKNLP